MKQRGGLILPFKREQSNEMVFWDYLEYSTIDYLTRGTMGIMFRTSPGPLFESLSEDDRFYRVSPDDSFGSPVDNLLIKVVLITDKSYDFKFSTNVVMASVTKEEFTDEINIQTDIYMKTIQYLQPICPGIVYSTIINPNDPKYEIFLNSISNVDFKNAMTMVRGFNKPSLPVKVGIIGMEFMSRCTTLLRSIYNIETDYGLPQPVIKRVVRELKNVCRYLLLDLALKTGYNHGDFHPGNFMIDHESYGYFENVSIRPILIDFGRTFKISPAILSKIKDCVSNKKYTEALSYLCDYRSSNQFIKDPIYAPRHYGWVCGDYNSNNPGYIDELTSDLLASNNSYVDAYNAAAVASAASKGLPPPQLMTKATIDEIRSTISSNAVPLEPGINDEIQNLFDEREEALTIITNYMGLLHGEEPDRYPLLPLSNAIKNKLYNGMIGGMKHRKKSRKNIGRKRKTRKLVK